MTGPVFSGFKGASRAGALLLSAVILSVVAFHRSPYMTYGSPRGSYYAEVTYYTWRSFFPAMPGQSGDKPGFVEVFHDDGVSCGRVPVPMVNSVELAWTESGASINGRAEWDFKRGSCYYWDKSDSYMIYVKGSPHDQQQHVR